MMNLRCLGIRTDLFFPKFDGEILDRGEYLAVRTPSNPTYYFGTLLVFPQAPIEGDLERWERLFRREFSDDPAVQHRTFCWDSPGGDTGTLEPFIEQGYVPDVVPVMCAAVAPESVESSFELSFRELQSDSDWSKQRTLSMDGDELDGEPSSTHTLYKTRIQDRYRRIVADGHGFWLGAFHEARLIASCGLFFDAGLGRFQVVETHPEFRNQRVASALVAEAMRRGLDQGKAQRLVITAEQGGSAERIYARLGFKVEGVQTAIIRRPGGN